MYTVCCLCRFCATCVWLKIFESTKILVRRKTDDKFDSSDDLVKNWSNLRLLNVFMFF
jgi:hypothetical protein